MNSQEIIARLRENERALRARGVTHAAVFGSRARGDDRPDSDTDIMIEIDPDAPVGVYGQAHPLSDRDGRKGQLHTRH